MTHLLAVGGSDAGIAAALRARELDPSTAVTVVLADEFPNFSICGIPYWVSGDVATEASLAHRTRADLEAAGMTVRSSTWASSVDVDGRRLTVTGPTGDEEIAYDELLIGTGAEPVRPAGVPFGEPGIHLLHSMTDAEQVVAALELLPAGSRVAVVGAGYIGLEMTEGLVARGFDTTLIQRGPEVLSTLDPELGSLVTAEVRRHGATVLTGSTVTGITPAGGGQWRVATGSASGDTEGTFALVVVCVGVRPVTDLAVAAGAQLGQAGAIVVDASMRTGVPHVWAAGDCVVTHHRLLGTTWLPLGTTAHKQGRVAGENMLGGSKTFAGSVGTQVVKVFDLVAARTGLRQHETGPLEVSPLTRVTVADDHKRYYPGAVPLTISVTGDQATGRLLGAQIVGQRTAEISKRIDTFATALHAELTVDDVIDLDLSYTPPLGSPWDAVQVAAQGWERAAAAANQAAVNQAGVSA
ncbi:NADPH-dependent 2,4-dienoyl-CoA reductase/sulfur reductase-like enzyme [Curtobacterium sp. PhB142]|uniref:FAD-dependent oxidoreductase n=1 Tax=unclassified Curtobacterium TaxID=257496 RepID=UPI000F4EFFDA|nr:MULTISPECIES: FAD-dependent oxidoreductase [unclassified Curtobacterium]RPE83206.1 NADPH-dependent 2,4-dienoyl-CoA reductase/sulfur reductase-like enzyme [Curtobacterium sp. PhB137]TCL88750.1 NADPH-dependent 2,4-dienoyl-CoA reductase/sulfur reductase-like enzyme [Curtobacterium sp. PhB142]TCM03887.1 NADPH-dependent 2,4-dienoyl-CoA reductase/sulfur reductase-like enzyme [Curtobacterium sp. PhB134]